MLLLTYQDGVLKAKISENEYSVESLRHVALPGSILSVDYELRMTNDAGDRLLSDPSLPGVDEVKKLDTTYPGISAIQIPHQYIEDGTGLPFFQFLGRIKHPECCLLIKDGKPTYEVYQLLDLSWNLGDRQGSATIQNRQKKIYIEGFLERLAIPVGVTPPWSNIVNTDCTSCISITSNALSITYAQSREIRELSAIFAEWEAEEADRVDAWKINLGDYLSGDSGVSKVIEISRNFTEGPGDSWFDTLAFHLENGDIVRCGECDRVTVHYPEATQEKRATRALKGRRRGDQRVGGET